MTSTAGHNDLAFVRVDEEPILAPPRGNAGPIAWILNNLFASFGNMLATVVGVAFVIAVLPPIIRWAFIDAVWNGDGRDACTVPGAGACWAFVRAKFGQFMYGQYTLGERWRVDLTGVLLIIGLVPMAIPSAPFKREDAVYLLLVFPIVGFILLTGGNLSIGWGLILFLVAIGCIVTAMIAMGSTADLSPTVAGMVGPAAAVVAILVMVAAVVFDIPTVAIGGLNIPGATILIGAAAAVALLAGLYGVAQPGGRHAARSVLTAWVAIASLILLLFILGFDFGLPWVETPLWGGLLVTLVVAIVGIVGSMPLGIVLALGRRSKLPIIKFVSIVFIEFVRGVPLITVLFMASVMLPLFLPAGVNFDKMLRALIGVTLFSAAYMAEVVRGGLQAIPKGQYEAAQALGLNYWRSMRLIVLPQALKIVIPGIVNSFISLFKDTSLVLIIGIFDLLGTVQRNFTDTNWAGPSIPATGYVFAAVVYWIFCFSMSRYSLFIERRLARGDRR